MIPICEILDCSINKVEFRQFQWITLFKEALFEKIQQK